MQLSRRRFGKLAAAGIPALASIPPVLQFGPRAHAQTSSKKIDSKINGVQIGLQPFCYHDLPMRPENRHVLIERMVRNGIGVVELHAVWAEPIFHGPGVTPKEAREKLRDWRTKAAPEHYTSIKKEFDDAGISIFTYYSSFGIGADRASDEEIDATFRAAKILGAKGVVGSYGLQVAQRIASFPGKYGMFGGIHNHDNLSDPDAFSTEATFEKGLAFSPDIMATLDVRHFTAGDGDCIGFLQRHHERVSSVHLGDRKRHNGRSTPFGQGDAPIIEVLQLIRDNEWPIVALLEFEHGTLRSQVDEVQIAFDYCKNALA